VSLQIIVIDFENLKPQEISGISGIIPQVGGAKMAYDKKKEFQPIKVFLTALNKLPSRNEFQPSRDKKNTFPVCIRP
jgi:hypothetical protein